MTFLFIFLWAWAIGSTVGFWSCWRNWQRCNERWAKEYQELGDRYHVELIRNIRKPKEEARA